MGPAALALLGVWLLLRVGLERPAVAVGAVLLVALLEGHVDASYGSGADPQFDGAKRMSPGANALVDRLAKETAIQPGAVFRGYVQDVYARTPGAGNVGDEIVGHWLQNRAQYGGGQALYSWGVFDIPTISEYDPFIRAPY